jgi:ubiquitin-protein ligase/Mg-chelatase subunit ChlD
MTIGQEIVLTLDLDPPALLAAIRKADPGLASEPQLHVYLPGGAIFETGTIDDFLKIFPKARHHIYVVATRPIAPAILTAEIKQLVDIRGDSQQLLLSPRAKSTTPGLCLIASLLGYIHHSQGSTPELIYSLSKLIPFAPLVANLHLLASREQIYGYMIPPITAPLQTLFAEMHGTPRDLDSAFDHTLDLIPYFSTFSFSGPLQCTLFKQPFMQVGYERFFTKFNSPTIPVLDADFRGIDHIALKFSPPSESEMKSISANDDEFCPVPVMAARRQNRTRFIQMSKNMALFLGSSASKLVDGKQESDKMTILDPSIGTSKEWIPGELAIAVGRQDRSGDLAVNRIVNIEEVDEVIMVCVDRSGSMGWPWDDTVTRIFATRNFFERFVDQAYRFRIDNFYGLMTFANSTSNLQSLECLAQGFRDQLQNIVPSGGTYLWKCLEEASKVLGKFSPQGKLPSQKKLPLRIIALTDGLAHETDKAKAPAVTSKLIELGIHLDAIFITKDEIEYPLLTAALMTGGSAFLPDTLDAGIRFFENEAYFRASLRAYNEPDRRPFADVNSEVMKDANAAWAKAAVKAKPIEFGPRTFGDAAWFLNEYRDRPVPNRRHRRILDEVETIYANPNLPFQAWIDQTEIGNWHVLIQGFEETVWAGRWWDLYVSFPRDYPSSPPVFTFVNPPPYHLNVTEHGRIVLPVINEFYDDSFPVYIMVNEIRWLLADPRENNAVDDARRAVFTGRRDEYDGIVKEAIIQTGRQTPDEISRKWTEAARGPRLEPRQGNPDPHPFWKCPITHKLMERPVKCSTGTHYEKAALEQKIREEGLGKARCVMHGTVFVEADQNLPVDMVLSKKITDWRNAHG